MELLGLVTMSHDPPSSSFIYSRLFMNVQVTSDKKMLSEAESPGLNGISIFWGGLVRVDILKVSLYFFQF